MLAPLIQKVLSRVLGDYVQNIKEEDMELDLMAGNIQLCNLEFKRDFFDNPRVPFSLSHGFISLIKVKMSPTKLSSVPIELSIEGVDVALSPKNMKDLKFFHELSVPEKEEAIKNYIASNAVLISEKVRQEIEGKESQSYMKRLLIKVVDNLQLSIKDVNCRIQGDYGEHSSFTFGFSVKELIISNTNAKWEKSFIDRTDKSTKGPTYKLMSLNGFSLFLYTGASLPENTVGFPHSRPELLKDSLILKPCIFLPSNKTKKDISLTVRFTHAPSAVQSISLEIEVPKVNLQISKPQYEICIFVGERVNHYFKSLTNIPAYRVSDKESPGTIKELEGMRNENAILWWKYAAKCIKKVSIERDMKKSQFLIGPILMKYYRDKFIEIILKQCKKEEELTLYEVRTYEKILSMFHLKVILKWVKTFMQELERIQQLGSPKETKKGSLLKSFFTWGSKTPEPKSPQKLPLKEELRRILSIIDEGKESEPISGIKCKLTINKGKSLKETVEFCYQGLNVNYRNFEKDHFVKVAVREIECLSVGSQHGEVTKFLNVSDPTNDYLDFEINITKKGNDSLVSAKLNAKSIVLYYQQIVIYRLIQFLGNYITSSIVRRTNVSVSNIKQDSLEIFTYSLTRYHFDLVALVESPVVLIPVMKNGDPGTPIWAFNMGNLKVISKDEENRDPKYIHIYSEVSSTRIEYHPSYLEYARNPRSGAKPVLTDVAAKAKISISVFPAEIKKEPKVAIKTDFSEVNLHFEPGTYKEFIKIGNTLKLEPEILKMLRTDKVTLVKDAKKIDSVFCFSEKLAKWKRNYVILSGAYLYLYETNKQVYPSHYYYLLNGVIKDEGSNDSLGLHILSISNKYGICQLGCKTEKQKDEWKILLTNHIRDFCELKDVSSLINKKVASKTSAIIASAECHIPKITLNMREDKDWMTAKLGQTTFTLIVRPQDFLSTINIQKFSLSEVNNTKFPRILTIEQETNAAKCTISGQSKLSPYYKDKQFVMQLEVGKVISWYHPKTISRLIQYISPKPVPEPAAENNIEIEVLSDEVRAEHCCTKNSTESFSLSLSLQGAVFHCLHPEHGARFCDMNLASLAFLYSRRVDHQEMTFHLGQASVLDLTGYPDTVIAQDSKQPVPKQTLTLIPDPKIPTVQIFSFKDDCPMMPKAIPNTKTLIKMNVKEVYSDFMYEILLKRQIPYVINCFVGAFISPSPKSSSKSPFAQFDFAINKVSLLIKPRETYEVGYTVLAEGLQVRNNKKEGHRPNLELAIMEIVARRVTISHGKNAVVDPFDFSFSIESPSKAVPQDDSWLGQIVEPALYQKITVSTKVPLKATLNPYQFNLLLQCVDLNLTYTDGLTEHFSFTNMINQRKLSGKILQEKGTIFTFLAPSILIAVHDWTDEWFFQIQIAGVFLKNEFYLNGRSVLKLSAKSACIYDKNIDHDRSLALYHKESSERHSYDNDDPTIRNIDIVAESRVLDDACKTKDTKYKVSIANQQIVLRGNTMLLIKQFLDTSRPNYEILPYKPNKYYSCPKNMSLHVTLSNYSFVIFGEESQAKALAIEGTLEMKMQTIGIKEVTDESLVYSKACDNKPFTRMEAKVVDLVAFISQSNGKEKGPFLLKNCKNRLLIEPATVGFTMDRTWNFQPNETCTMCTSTVLSTEQLTATLTLQDVYFMLGVLRHQLKHIMSDYVEKIYKYYIVRQQNSSSNAQKLIAHRLSHHLEYNLPKAKVSGEKPAALKSMSDLGGVISDTFSLFNAFKKEMGQLDRLKQHSSTQKKDCETGLQRLASTDLPQPINYEYRKITHSTSKFKATFEHDIKAICINNIAGVFYPLLEIEVEVPVLRNLHDEYSNQLFEAKAKVCANYYHCAASAWEPLLEPFRIEYLSEFNAEQSQSTTKINFPDKINLNVTDTLMLLVKDSIELWKNREQQSITARNLFIRKCRKSECNLGRKSILNSVYDSITEFMVKNHAGVTFYITVKDSVDIQRHPIFPNETVNLLIDPSEALSKIKRTGKNNFIIRVEFDPETGISPVENVNLAHVKEFTHSYMMKGEKQHFVCAVRVEQMRKVFSVSTPFSISNGLDLPVILNFQVLVQDPIEYKLGPGKEFNIPVRLLQETVRISTQDTDSGKLAASKFTFKSLSKLFDTHKAVQITLAKGAYGVLALKRGSSHYCLLPPYNFVNCLPVKLKLQLPNNYNATKLGPGKSSLDYSSSTTVPLVFSISLPHFRSQEVKFKYDPDLLDIPLQIKDENGNDTTIYMRILVGVAARYTIVFYSKECIINWTKQNLVFYYYNEDSEEVTVAGQYIGDKNISLLGKHKSFICYLNDLYPSTPITIDKNLPSTEFAIVHKKKPHHPHSLSEFVTYTQKEPLLSTYRIHSKVLNVYPKYLFRNKTKSVIILGQTAVSKSKIPICPNEEVPFFWHLKDGPKTVQLSYPESLSSEPFRPDEVGTFVQELTRSNDRKIAGIIRVERIKHKGVYYIEVYCEFAERPYYLIHNACENVTVAYRQEGTNGKYKYLDANTTVPFGWARPDLSHSVTLKFLWGKLEEAPIEFLKTEKTFPLDEIKPEKRIKLPLTEKWGKYVWVSVEYDGHSNVLKISDTRKHDLNESTVTKRNELEVAGIGVSLVASQEWKRLELFYATLDRLLLRTIEAEGKKELYFSIQKVQVDNQTKQAPAFPVILYATKEEAGGHAAEDEPFFQLAFVMNELSNPRCKFYSFDFIKASTTPLTIKLEEDLIVYFYEFFLFCKNSLLTQSSLYHSSCETSLKPSVISISTPEDFTGKATSSLAPTVHINDFGIQRLPITIWLKPGGSHGRKRQGILLKAFTAGFLKVEALPIVLDRILGRRFHCKITELLLGIAEIYKGGLAQQKISIISSLLFAHIRDIEYIGVGIAEMIRRESENGEKSSGFVKNAILGTFGTASKLAAIASKGVLALSNDDEYISKLQREEEELKPKHVLEGVGLGAYSALRSIASAIYGVVSKPVEGAMQENVGGFVKGAFNGLTGAIVKPISGGLDFISKITEGVKNTAVLFDEPKVKDTGLGRIRRPRVFYTSQSLIQQYDDNHAKLLPALMGVDNGKYLTNNFLDIGIEKNKELGIVLITEEHIVHFINDQVKWEIDKKFIVLVELDSTTIILHLSDGKNVGEVRLSFTSKEVALSIYNKLNNAIIND